MESVLADTPAFVPVEAPISGTELPVVQVDGHG